MHRQVLATLFLAASGLSPAFAVQDDPAAVVWAAGCYTCHGPEGRSEGGMPSLVGQSADGIYQALSEFRQGRRPATVMDRHAKGYTDDQLRRIAQVLGAAKQ